MRLRLDAYVFIYVRTRFWNAEVEDGSGRAFNLRGRVIVEIVGQHFHGSLASPAVHCDQVRFGIWKRTAVKGLDLDS